MSRVETQKNRHDDRWGRKNFDKEGIRGTVVWEDRKENGTTGEELEEKTSRRVYHRMDRNQDFAKEVDLTEIHKNNSGHWTFKFMVDMDYLQIEVETGDGTEVQG